MTPKLQARLGLVAAALGVYAAVAAFLNKTLWPKPAPDAARWKRGLHSLFIDWPAALPSKNLKGIFSLFGVEFSIPYVTLSREPPPPPTYVAPRAGGQAGKVEPILVIALALFVAGALALFLTGCATSATPAGATTAQKLQDDMAAARTITADVLAKCGPMYVPIVPAITGALATAATAPGAMGIILACIEAAPAVYTDAQALVCAIRVVAEDLKAMRPGPAGQKAAQLGAEIAAFYELGPRLSALDVNEPPNICLLEEPPRPAP